MSRLKRDVVHSLAIKLCEPEASALRRVRAYLIEKNIQFNPTASDAIRTVIMYYHDTVLPKEIHNKESDGK